MNSTQSRMARAALDWSTRETAQKAGIGVNTLSRFERGADVFASTVDQLRRTYEGAGIVFIAEGAPSITGGAGVRLAKGEVL